MIYAALSASGGVPAEPQKLHELVQAGIGSLVGGHVMRAGLGTRPVLPVMPAVVIIIMVIMVRRTGAVIIIIIMAMVAACGQDGYGCCCKNRYYFIFIFLNGKTTLKEECERKKSVTRANAPY